MKNNDTAPEARIFTLPNLLSFLRICLVPMILHAYAVKDNTILAGILLLLSGLTDIADGYIARHFHMVTDLGKALDPIADKLTQACVLYCLCYSYPPILGPFLLLVLKELWLGAWGIRILRKTGMVLGAEWHGKAATTFLYALMGLHMFWPEVPAVITQWSAAAACVLILLSFVLYYRRYRRTMKQTSSFDSEMISDCV